MPRLLLITTFGLGHMRPASGTWGSMPPVVVAGGLWLLGQSPGQGSSGTIVYHAVLGAIAIVFGVVCVRDGAKAEATFGHDPKEVVADETSAQCLPLLLLPAHCFASWQSVLVWLASAFVLFRVLDIVKPWPAHGLQRIAGGWGILLDDVFAALYALALMQLATRVLWAGGFA